MAPSGVPREAASIAPKSTEVLGSAPVPLSRILVALDASDHANCALDEAARLAATAGGAVTGIHAYAAKLRVNRFRQMEGGLPALSQGTGNGAPARGARQPHHPRPGRNQR